MISFVYEWLDIKTELKYIGRHVGSLGDGYVGSGTIFKKEYAARPKDFVRSILWQEEYTTDDVVKLREEEILDKIPDDELYNGVNRKYYNQVKNSWGYTSTNNPMKNPDVVARMMATRESTGGYRSPYENTILKYGNDGAKRIRSESKLGNTAGSGNKGKPKSEEHKKNISAGVKRAASGKTGFNGGRKPIMPPQDLIELVTQLGYKSSAELLNIPVATLRCRYYNACTSVKCKDSKTTD